MRVVYPMQSVPPARALTCDDGVDSYYAVAIMPVECVPSTNAHAMIAMPTANVIPLRKGVWSSTHV